jgi:hypothetical protein
VIFPRGFRQEAVSAQIIRTKNNIDASAIASSYNLESLPGEVVEPWNNGICEPFRKHVVTMPCAKSDEVFFIFFGP